VTDGESELSRSMLYLIGGQSHELLGLLVPDGWHGDDPAYVVVVDGCSALVAQFSQCVIFEELERHRDHLEYRKALSIGRLDLCVFRAVLQ